MTEIEQLLYEAVATATRQDKINAWFAKWSDREVIQSQMASTCQLLDEAVRQVSLRMSEDERAEAIRAYTIGQLPPYLEDQS